MAKSPLQDEPTSAEHSQDKSWPLDGLPHASNGFDELPAEQGEQSSRQSASDWRAGCGKSASPVWRQWRRNSLRCPYLDLSSLASFARACFRRIIARKIVGLVRSTLVRTDTICQTSVLSALPCRPVASCTAFWQMVEWTWMGIERTGSMCSIYLYARTYTGLTFRLSINREMPDS